MARLYCLSPERWRALRSPLERRQRLPEDLMKSLPPALVMALTETAVPESHKDMPMRFAVSHVVGNIIGFALAPLSSCSL